MEQRLAVLTAVLVTVEKVAAQGVCTGVGPQMSWDHGSPCNDPWACNQGGTCQHWQTADGCVADPNTCVGWRQTESECSPNWVPQENFDTGCCTIIQTGYDQPLYSHGNSGCECKMVDGTSIETPELTCDEIKQQLQVSGRVRRAEVRRVPSGGLRWNVGRLPSELRRHRTGVDNDPSSRTVRNCLPSRWDRTKLQRPRWRLREGHHRTGPAHRRRRAHLRPISACGDRCGHRVWCPRLC